MTDWPRFRKRFKCSRSGLRIFLAGRITNKPSIYRYWGRRLFSMKGLPKEGFCCDFFSSYWAGDTGDTDTRNEPKTLGWAMTQGVISSFVYVYVNKSYILMFIVCRFMNRAKFPFLSEESKYFAQRYISQLRKSGVYLRALRIPCDAFCWRHVCFTPEVSAIVGTYYGLRSRREFVEFVHSLRQGWEWPSSERQRGEVIKAT